mmetsp:Transcript_6478/g.23453  ORF Transcript_6478/g.23453 Transcript_6478/m.23453 type:complete len:102 (-) Transcript_6478:5-310(-)
MNTMHALRLTSTSATTPGLRRGLSAGRKMTTPRRASGARADGAAPEYDGECQVIVVTSGKGGVGKTTSSANLGMSMARLGYRVALIDADIGFCYFGFFFGL